MGWQSRGRAGFATTGEKQYNTSMNQFLRLLLAAILCSLSMSAFAEEGGKKIRVLIVTGGHDFEREPFFKMFKDNPDISFVAAEHPNAHALLRPEKAKDFDVMVTYDMHQPISDQAKSDFVEFLKAGKGLVVLHHAIASYKDWPEYQQIIGARYYLGPVEVDGVQKPASKWKHGVDIAIEVADASHPVTRGLKDFRIRDETYKLFDFFPGSTVLLTTKEPLSNREVAWARRYRGAGVVYIQSGHDHVAFEHPDYRKLVRQAIQWTAKKG